MASILNGNLGVPPKRSSDDQVRVTISLGLIAAYVAAVSLVPGFFLNLDFYGKSSLSLISIYSFFTWPIAMLLIFILLSGYSYGFRRSNQSLSSKLEIFRQELYNYGISYTITLSLISLFFLLIAQFLVFDNSVAGGVIAMFSSSLFYGLIFMILWMSFAQKKEFYSWIAAIISVILLFLIAGKVSPLLLGFFVFGFLVSLLFKIVRRFSNKKGKNREKKPGH